MPDEASRQLIDALLGAAGQIEPPVHLTAVLEHCEVLVYSSEEIEDEGFYVLDPGDEGGLYIVNGRRFIVVSGRHSFVDAAGFIVRHKQRTLTRIKSTIAHELGHLIVHHLRGVPAAMLWYRSPEENRIFEDEAGDAGAYLLTPDAWVRDAWVREQRVIELAKLFEVSRQMMTRRLRALGLLAGIEERYRPSSDTVLSPAPSPVL